MEDAIQQVHEQRMNADMEVAAYKKELHHEQGRLDTAQGV